jgi:hypothetical protein
MSTSSTVGVRNDEHPLDIGVGLDSTLGRLSSESDARRRHPSGEDTIVTIVESPLHALPGVERRIELVPLFRGAWKLDPYVLVPDGPVGSRAIVEMPEGVLEGRGLRARTKGRANADWLLVGPDGIGTADWRGTVETEDGAVLYLHGGGRIDLRGGFGAGAMLIGEARFEASDARYRWLNAVHAVFRGVVVGEGKSGEAVYHDEYFEVR